MDCRLCMDLLERAFSQAKSEAIIRPIAGISACVYCVVTELGGKS